MRLHVEEEEEGGGVIWPMDCRRWSPCCPNEDIWRAVVDDWWAALTNWWIVVLAGGLSGCLGLRADYFVEDG